MWWLRDRIHGRRRRQRHEPPTGEQPVPETPARKPPEPDRGRPRLVLLVRDAAGPASYQLHSFEDEPEAASFVQFWFPGDFDHGVIGFWASHREPEVMDGERPAEVIVLVRDQSRSKTVCPFSFAGLDMAQSWVARESDRGLDLHPDHVLIFWAVSARISRDHWGRVHLWPSESPASRPNGTRATLTGPAAPQMPAPTPPAETPAPKQDEPPFEQALDLPAGLLTPIKTETAEQAPDLPVEDAPAAQELPIAGEAEVEAPPAAWEAEVEAPPAAWETEVEAPPAAVESGAEAPPPAAEAELEAPPGAEAPELEAPPAVEMSPRVDEKKPAAPRKAKHRKGHELFGADKEIEEFLRRSGWEKREGPFRGFGSPPGKF